MFNLAFSYFGAHGINLCLHLCGSEALRGGSFGTHFLSHPLLLFQTRQAPKHPPQVFRTLFNFPHSRPPLLLPDLCHHVAVV